jgi:hypothetical protein
VVRGLKKRKRESSNDKDVTSLASLDVKGGYSEINLMTDVKFHDPYIFYIYDNNEIWLHKVNEQEIIHRFIFINTITAVDMFDNYYFDSLAEGPMATFVCLLEYNRKLKLAELSFRTYPQLDNRGDPIKGEGFVEGNNHVLIF